MSSKGFTQQLIGTDAEAHRQILGGNQKKSCGRRERRIMEARGAKDTLGKCTESIDPGSWGLTETELPTRELAWD